MQIPKHAKIGISWALITAGGVYAFLIAKQDIDKKRYEHMKVRERMRKSTTGEYELTRKF